VGYYRSHHNVVVKAAAELEPFHFPGKQNATQQHTKAFQA
jgi:hypothetical protein